MCNYGGGGLPSLFPGLKSGKFEITSRKDQNYNCVAWAADDDSCWWWPDHFRTYYWPRSVARSASLEAFMEAFRTLGYAHETDDTLEINFEKVAFFVKDGQVAHVSRQLDDGMWTSKIGKNNDIKHALRGLEGEEYGEMVCIVKREKK